MIPQNFSSNLCSNTAHLYFIFAAQLENNDTKDNQYEQKKQGMKGQLIATTKTFSIVSLLNWRISTIRFGTRGKRLRSFARW